MNNKDIIEVFEKLLNKNNKLIRKKFNKEYFDKIGVNWEFYQEIFNNDEKLHQILYEEKHFILRYKNSYQHENKCVLCEKDTEFVGLFVGYKKYCCKECEQTVRTNTIRSRTPDQEKIKLTKRKKTCLERYGDENYNNKEKIFETQSKLYGGFFNIKQSKQTKLERYGDENYNNSDKNKKTMFERTGYETNFENPKVREKIWDKHIELHGSKCPIMNPLIKEKSDNTKLLRYGITTYTNPELLKKTLSQFNSDYWKDKNAKKKQTCLERYGDENYINLEKVEETNIRKYGVKNISQAGLDTNSGYKWKEYTLPSGKIIKYQGYEDKLLDELLLEYHEDEILTSRADMPEFWYIGLDGKNHRYFPDCYIPKTNTIYEVKSEWTLNSSFETNILKFNSVRYKGYNLKIMIY